MIFFALTVSLSALKNSEASESTFQRTFWERFLCNNRDELKDEPNLFQKI